MSHYRFTNPDGTTLAWVNIDTVQAACPLGNGKISLQLSRTSLEVDAAQFEDALKKCPIVLLGRHGAMAVGADLAEALGLLQFMENQCHIYDIAKRIMTPPLFTEGDGVAHI